MLPTLRVLVCIAIGAVAVGNGALAQQSPKQIKLSVAQIEAYLAAQPEVLEIQKKIVMREVSGGTAADIEAVVQKHGFRDAEEYSIVLNNLILVFNRIDPKTKAIKNQSGEQVIEYSDNVNLVIQYYDKIRVALVGP